MAKKLAAIVFLGNLAIRCLAQTVTVPNNDGVGTTLPVFTGNTTIENSRIYTLDGNVGINITSPTAPLGVLGNVVIGANYHGDASLQIIGPQGCCQRMTQIEAGGVSVDALNVMSSSDSNGAPHYWSWGVRQNQWTVSPGATWAATPAFTIDSSGHVGLGTNSPQGALEVKSGNVLLTGSGASITFSDGSVQSTAWNGTTLGGDYAESIDVLGNRADYEPGDIIAIDPLSPGRFNKSTEPYSRLVAGVFSTKPGLVGRRTTFARTDKDAEVPMAMAGIVPTKVSAENGAIEIGDLLVSSSRAGYAMKATDTSRLNGAVIGKALSPLPTGYGVVEVMISLQ